MKKGQICEGYVERLDFPNKGVLSFEDEKVVVKNVLPGQKISFMITKKRKGKAEGRLLDVLENAPYEIPSVCPHFGVCGGCAYQTLPYDKQLELKKGQVRKLLTPVFAKQALLDGEAELTDEYVNHIFEGIKGSPVQSAYRNKMEFSFGDEVKDGPLSLGMHKRGSFYDIVSVRECQLVDEDYRKILNTTLDYFTQKGTSYYHRMRHEGYLRHLLVRKAQKTCEILIALITTTQEEQDLQPYVDALDFMVEMANEDCTPSDSLATASTESQELFNNGKVAMQLNLSHQYPAAVEALGADKVGCAPMIAGSAGVGATTGPWYECVMKNSENKDMALKYVEYMYDHNADYMNGTLKIAGRTSVYEEAGKEAGNEHTTAVLDTLNEKQSQPRPMISTWSQVEQVLTGVVESCLDGADVKETLESAKEEIEAIGK